MTHTYSHVTCRYQSCHIYVWVMSHICMSHVTYVWVMSHICMSHVSYMYESCHKDVWVVSHACMSRVTYMYESCHIHVWVHMHTWLMYIYDPYIYTTHAYSLMLLYFTYTSIGEEYFDCMLFSVNDEHVHYIHMTHTHMTQTYMTHSHVTHTYTGEE